MNAPELLTDMEWLSRLAHRLVRDPALADDAVQDAWLAAQRRLAARGEGAAPDRRLLGKTLRGVILQALRGARRREFHETKGARGEALPSTEELLLVGERQQLLWQHLKGLEEPFRSALLLRYQQSLSTQELAARQGEKEDTVRWRTRRGLELLRDSLMKEDGEAGLMGMVPVAALAFRPWTAAPAGAAGSAAAGGGASALTRAGAIWMTHKLTVCLLAAFAALAAGIVAVRARPVTAERPLAQVTGEADGPADLPALVAGPRGMRSGAHDPSAPDLASGPSTGRQESADGAHLAAEALAKTSVAHGRVVDTSGRPVAGATVVLGSQGPGDPWPTVNASRGRIVNTPSPSLDPIANVPGEPLVESKLAPSVQATWQRSALTNADGRFEISGPSEPRRTISLAVVPQGFYALSFVSFGRGANCSQPPFELPRMNVGDLILRRAGVAEGRVVDPHGEPIVGVSVSGNPWTTVTTDDAGRFRLSGLELGSNYLHLRADGYIDGGQELSLTDGEVLELGPLTMETARLVRVTGRVVDPRGLPVPGASVTWRDRVAAVAHDGSFELAFPGDDRLYLRASAEGFRNSKAHLCRDRSEAHMVLQPAGALRQFLVVDG